MLFDLLIGLRLRHDLSKVVAPTPRLGSCETWVPLGPHRPGSQPSPTSGSGLPEDPRRPVSGPNRPSWRPTRPPKDLPEDSQTTLSRREDSLARKTRQPKQIKEARISLP
jgi:hypothetical protein